MWFYQYNTLNRVKNNFIVVVKRFQNRVAESRFALPIVAVYGLLVCMAYGLFSQQLWLQFGLLAASAFLMVELNNANALIRIYSRMVSCSFLVLALLSCQAFVDVKCGVVQLCFIAFYLFFFHTYQDKHAVGRIFYAFMMLGIASTMFLQILYFLPIAWILMYTNMLSGGARTLLASVMGVVVPYMFWGAYGVYTGYVDTVYSHIMEFVTFGELFDYSHLSVQEIVTAAFVCLLSFTGMIHFRRNNYRDRIRTRMVFEIFTTFALATIVFIVLQPVHFNYLLSMLMVSTAPMIGHYIALTKTWITNISFYVMMLAALLITVSNIWMPF